MPGIMTVTEAMQAWSLGADTPKLFPGNILWPKFIQAPLPQVSPVPTGVIASEQAGDWIRAGAVAVGIGNHLNL